MLSAASRTLSKATPVPCVVQKLMQTQLELIVASVQLKLVEVALPPLQARAKLLVAFMSPRLMALFALHPIAVVGLLHSVLSPWLK